MCHCHVSSYMSSPASYDDVTYPHYRWAGKCNYKSLVCVRQRAKQWSFDETTCFMLHPHHTQLMWLCIMALTSRRWRAAHFRIVGHRRLSPNKNRHCQCNSSDYCLLFRQMINNGQALRLLLVDKTTIINHLNRTSCHMHDYRPMYMLKD